jgi:hypothetical protein
VKIEEALPALRAGKKLANEGLGLLVRDWSGVASLMAHHLSDHGWTIVEEPLTDEQLIAEWRRLAVAEDLAADRASPYIAKAYNQCAKQLRERKL